MGGGYHEELRRLKAGSLAEQLGAEFDEQNALYSDDEEEVPSEPQQQQQQPQRDRKRKAGVAASSVRPVEGVKRAKNSVVEMLKLQTTVNIETDQLASLIAADFSAQAGVPTMPSQTTSVDAAAAAHAADVTERTVVDAVATVPMPIATAPVPVAPTTAPAPIVTAAAVDPPPAAEAHLFNDRETAAVDTVVSPAAKPDAAPLNAAPLPTEAPKEVYVTEDCSKLKWDQFIHPQWSTRELTVECPGLLLYCYDVGLLKGGRLRLSGRLRGNRNATAGSVCLTLPFYRKHVWLHVRVDGAVPETEEMRQERGTEMLNSVADGFRALVQSYGLAEHDVEVKPVWRRLVDLVSTSGGGCQSHLWFELSYRSTFVPPIRDTDLRLGGVVDFVVRHESAHEEFIVEQSLMGPSWLYLPIREGVSSREGPALTGELHQVKTEPPPILSVSSLMLKLVRQPKSDKILHGVFGVVTNQRLFGLGRTDTKIENGQSYYSIYTKASVQPCANIRVHDDLVKWTADFMNQLRLMNPDILMGHGIAGWMLGLFNLLALTRINNWNARSVGAPLNRKTTDPSGLFPGRLVLDTRKLAEDLLTARVDYEIGGMRDLHHIDAPNLCDELELSALFAEAVAPLDLAAALADTLKEPVMAYMLAMNLKMIPMTHEIAALSGCPWQKALACQRAERNEYLLMHFLRQKEYLWRLARVSDGPAPPSTYTGGLVLDPVVGFHDSYILYLDFASLYPSIIQEFNLDFTTVTEAAEDLCVDYSKNAPVGVLPEILHVLVTKRRQIKASNNQNMNTEIRQRAIKLVANSLYGSLGFKSFRFYAPTIAATTTAWGRRVLTMTKTLLETKHGCKVIYGDTDSLMIDSGVKSAPDGYRQVMHTAHQLVEDINKTHKKLELEVECVFERMLLLSKKKYVALKLDCPRLGGPVSRTVVMKGVDIVRRDWCKATKELGNKLVNDIIMNNSVDADDMGGLIKTMVENFVHQLPAMSLDAFVISKSITKHLHQYAAEGSSGIPLHVRIARKLAEEGALIVPKSVIQYIVSDENREPYAYKQALKEDKRPDMKYYMSSQLLPPIQRLVEKIPSVRLNEIVAACGGVAKAEDDDPQKAFEDFSQFVTPTALGEGLAVLRTWSQFDGTVEVAQKISGEARGIVEHPNKWLLTNCCQAPLTAGERTVVCEACQTPCDQSYIQNLVDEQQRAVLRKLHSYAVYCRDCHTEQAYLRSCRTCGSSAVSLLYDQDSYNRDIAVLKLVSARLIRAAPGLAPAVATAVDLAALRSLCCRSAASPFCSL